MEHIWEHMPQVVEPGVNRHVVFLEEDHAVSEDFYDTVKGVAQLQDEWCPKCWGIGMSPYYYAGMSMDSYRADEFGIYVGVMNTGFAFGRETWKKLLALKEEFWAIDNGWDASLFELAESEAFPPHQLLAMLSRVKNIGQIGLNVDEAQYVEFGIGEGPVSQAKTFDKESAVLLPGIRKKPPPEGSLKSD